MKHFYNLFEVLLKYPYIFPRASHSEECTKQICILLHMAYYPFSAGGRCRCRGLLQLVQSRRPNLVWRIEAQKFWIPCGLIGGIGLGVFGTLLPMSLFSGENEMIQIVETYTGYHAAVLLLIGFVKIFLINLCVESGWMGGFFFPIIFACLLSGRNYKKSASARGGFYCVSSEE